MQSEYQPRFLSLGWKFSDFVEENRASACQLKSAQALLRRAGEAPFS
jgi:hypothetical protein